MALPVHLEIVFLSFAAVAYTQGTATVSAVAQASSISGVSGSLDASFAGFGIEPSNLFSFTGGSSTNSLSINLLQNLANYAGLPPHIRIGGNTADQMIYDPNYSSYSLKLTDNPTGQGVVPTDKFTFGPSYWKAISRFPTGTPITFGLNLAYNKADYIQNIVNEARACIGGLTGVQLASFEIGNEPDLYLQNMFRSGSWGGQVFTQEFLARASAVNQQVLVAAGLPADFFEPPATASTIGTTFQISDLVQAGITKGVNGSKSLVAGWNQHDYYYFVGVSSYQLTLDRLMQLSTTEDQFAYWVSQVKQAVDTKLPYYLREMANAGPIGIKGISDTFGAALWNLNFLLYAASVGVASVQMHMTDNSFASPWAPISMNGQGPHVRPSYYAFAAMAQLLGSGNGTTQIAAISPTNIPAGYPNYVRVYAAYTQGDVSAVVVINSKLASASTSAKSSVTFTLSFPNAKGQSLYVSILTAQGADSTADVTWNGISYEKTSDGTPTTVDQTVSVVTIDSNGNAAVTVRDSQAVIANIGFQLGSRNVVVQAGSPTTRKTNTASSGAAGSSTAVITAAITSAIALVSSTASPTTSSTSTGSAQPAISPSPTRSAASRKRKHPIYFKLLMTLSAIVVILVLAQAWTTA